ncbi:MAG: Gfo/Idh/MocA family oxidoreductase, partial [Deltaproteobacteria bacterium]|nr:Gfo/Idh/MocA family oxidoreductase [Deltaproteobacteria bacterium]
ESVVSKVLELTGKLGVDATIICAASKDDGPINLSAEITREQGVVTALGLVNMNVPREAFYRKELSLVLSRSLGPGRYDPSYENHGLDYPAAYVRWTVGRNMASYLQLAAAGKIDPTRLITHEFTFDQAISAYDVITSDRDEFYCGVLLSYDFSARLKQQPIILKPSTHDGINGRLGIGVIGVGSYASKFLLPYLKRERLRFVLSGSGYNAYAAAKRFGFEEVAAKTEHVIDDPDTDVVLIATRHNKHAEYAIQALNAGKAVFVEKPLCLSIEELQQIDSAHREGGFLHVGFNRRFSPAISVVKDFFSSTGPLLFNCRVNAGPLLDHWLLDPIEGGGRILGEVCHFIDILRFLAGSPITRVYCSGLRKRGVDAISYEDVVITLDFENCSTGTIVYTGSGSKALSKERYEIFSGEKAAVINDFRTVELYKGKPRKVRIGKRDTGQSEQMKQFLAGVREGKPPIPYAELIEVSLATFAVIESLTRAMPVDMREMWEVIGEHR